ncbi:cupin domain-containing protein [Bdellovibrio sp. BCCA]|uniref:cupin domain-containing protein n=1 Tax=Bdellovibrio sp. BCCA TaxID=3136281 RepID=UPI0030F3066E
MATQLTPGQPEKRTPETGTRSFSKKSFSKADEVRDFPKGKLELVEVNGNTVGLITLQPGWRWSTSVKPIAKTESCEVTHFQYMISGTLHVKMDDGTEMDFKGGEVAFTPPGHDAWVVGNEPVVAIDFQGMANYAKAPHEH